MDVNDILYPDDSLDDVILDPFAAYIEKPPMLCFEGERLITADNISAIVGPPKARKTSFAILLAAAYLSGGIERITAEGTTGDVLWIDTEQSPADCQRVYRRLARLRGLDEIDIMRDVTFVTLRDHSPTQRWAKTDAAIDRFTPSLVIIDGVADLISANNDEVSATRLQDFLLEKSLRHSCHIICIIHSNVGSEKARGHTGANLTRKCETIMTLYPRDCRTMCRFTTRGKELPEMFFTIDTQALPYPCDPPDSRRFDPAKMFTSILIPREVVTYGKLVELIRSFREEIGAPISDRYAKNLIASATKSGIIYRAKTGYALNPQSSLSPSP